MVKHRTPEEKSMERRGVLAKIKEKHTGDSPIDTILLCVGVGGVFYHGLSRMATWCHRRGNVGVVLVDPDKIIARNAARQWGVGVGADKVGIAGMVMNVLGVEVTVQGLVPRAMKEPEDIMDMIPGRIEYYKTIKRIVVMSTPDNHMARVVVHEGCGLVAQQTGLPVYEVTAGCAADHGYAYGCIHRKDIPTQKMKRTIPMPGVVCEGDYLRRHPDIKTEADAEREALANPQPCGAGPAEEDEQTLVSNYLSAGCAWDMAEMMVVEGITGEIQWANIEDKPSPTLQKMGMVGPTRRYTKIWATLNTKPEVKKSEREVTTNAKDHKSKV